MHKEHEERRSTHSPWNSCVQRSVTDIPAKKRVPAVHTQSSLQPGIGNSSHACFTPAYTPQPIEGAHKPTEFLSPLLQLHSDGMGHFLHLQIGFAGEQHEERSCHQYHVCFEVRVTDCYCGKVNEKRSTSKRRQEGAEEDEVNFSLTSATKSASRCPTTIICMLPKSAHRRLHAKRFHHLTKWDKQGAVT